MDNLVAGGGFAYHQPARGVVRACNLLVVQQRQKAVHAFSDPSVRASLCSDQQLVYVQSPSLTTSLLV
jgi:hypothetical protein